MCTPYHSPTRCTTCVSLLADLGRSNEDNGTKHTWVRVLPVCNLCGYWLVVRLGVMYDDEDIHELATPQHMHDASYVDKD